MKVYSVKLIIFLLALAGFNTSYGQQSNSNQKQDKTAQIQDLVNSKSFSFIAQTALPMGGRSINLTTPYDLKVSGDTVISDLPYFGRAFVAPVDPSEGGIHFKSTGTNYEVKQKKKGGWDITILPKDAKDIRQMFLTVTKDGYATLQVTSDDRQSIGYNGYIVRNKNRTVAARQ